MKESFLSRVISCIRFANRDLCSNVLSLGFRSQCIWKGGFYLMFF